MENFKDYIINYQFQWWHSVLYIILLAFLLSPIDFIKFSYFQFLGFLNDLKLVKDSFHEFNKMVYPGKHKTIVKSKYRSFYNGSFHEQVNTFNCSCGKDSSGEWVITGIKVSLEEGREYNEKNK